MSENTPNYDMGLPMPSAGTELEPCEHCKQLTIAKGAPKDAICYKCGLWKGRVYSRGNLTAKYCADCGVEFIGGDATDLKRIPGKICHFFCRPTKWIPMNPADLTPGHTGYYSVEWLWRNGDFATIYLDSHTLTVEICDIMIEIPRFYAYPGVHDLVLADFICSKFCERVPPPADGIEGLEKAATAPPY